MTVDSCQELTQAQPHAAAATRSWPGL